MNLWFAVFKHIYVIITYVQQNSCNLSSDNLDILIVWQLKRVIPGPEFLLLTKTIFISETGRPQGQVQKDLQECLYIDSSGIS